MVDFQDRPFGYSGFQSNAIVTPSTTSSAMSKNQDLRVAVHDRENEQLAVLVRRCGFILVASFLLLVPSSYLIAPLSPFGMVQPKEVEMFHRLVNAIPFLPESVAMFLKRTLSGDTAMSSKWFGVIAYVLPMLLASLAAGLVFFRLVRHREPINASIVHSLGRTAVVLAFACVAAYPIFTQDFWCSVAWSRMITDGNNPYYELFTTSSLSDIPLSHFEETMTYGPLWAITAAAVSFVSNRQVLVEFLLFKGILLVFWLLSLWLIRKTTESMSLKTQAIAICAFGWLPMSVHFSVGEGHNDISMVACILLWLFLVGRKRHCLAPLALMLSILFKYVTAPLILIEIWRGWSATKGQRWPYVLSLFACTGLSIAIFSPFFRDVQFFSGTRDMRNWHFFLPEHAITGLASRVGAWIGTSAGFCVLVAALCILVTAYVIHLFPSRMIGRMRTYWMALFGCCMVGWLALIGTVGHLLDDRWPGLEAFASQGIVRLGMGAVSLTCLVKFARERSMLHLAGVSLALLASILFTSIGHVWPWFVLWLLAVAALVRSEPLVRVVVPLALLSPFFNVYWILAPNWQFVQRGSNVMFSALFILVLLTWRLWDPSRDTIVAKSD